ncbi:MAG TPA: 1,6-dihydroxycyclohexa-2,4-diene-1-carboxylate dehydrogenase [Plasticicumulans sp.]|uniref:1,6-dihydroxycyclohexa-2,4-diene-1-carboxylate dehydrogenase n=2 Tax=Plasticicumulans sp. TaxID=2307179 RepID=UPI002BC4EB7D|nr:1,6-dihydroxycyclohexa-2,4-diene-1-carboxylate dehydrogenase [Plasticicumulans sp.]HMV38440.1 1,6-dihydroxycyclohexa-2,4-diene-1-carboxylate dehydrogenase [Plasticicumulans sp.]HMW29042.1 1,6-dihydroxycyclohexa-2,4-diene-1-carboxylate dehydrogenase [Plasticicumulans sp.]HMW42152.1 1,6-dihydroxycyclohexa-2,4-diene-1-carboxylate dehydrogenase [Plasticicumulans sp.]HMX54352.1 1,6-dihydroxycyclohexa-2,4-diene-1-carboxylate dehydrogenase [Plasticicumulans sp.]HMZ10478.1 1,6-dihydroxycyclohexa-2,
MIHAGRFNGRIAVVTGAAQGIGRTVAVNMAREGARVALVDRSPLIAEVHAEILAAGGEALAITADLERYGESRLAINEAHARFGRIDILVNNVGGTIWAKPFEQYAEDEIEAEVRRSLFPTLWGCRAVLPFMIAQQAGTIVNVSSVATRGVNRVPYGAAKGGVNALTACLAFECAGHGIRVLGIAPGGTEAPPRRIPRNTVAADEQTQAWYRQIVEQTVESSLMKRYGTLDEQAAAILFLASDEASYITGTILPVAGGDQG